MSLRRYLPVLALAGLVVALQLVLSATGTVFYLTQLTMAAYYGVVVIGLCLLMGFAGQISLGQAGFFAIGGYTAAVLSSKDLGLPEGRPLLELLDRLGAVVERQDLYGNTLHSFAPWVGLVAALVLALGVALLIGVPVIRLRGHYLAMATLGFGLIVYRVVLGTGFLGAADGISGVPGFPIGVLEISGGMARRVQNYYAAWFIVLVGMVLALNLIHSRVGRALRSIHGSEEAANAMGVNTARYKLGTFVLSALFAAVAGIFLTHYNGGIGPSEATSMKSVRYVAIVAAGGMDNLWGALLMGSLLNFLSLRGVFGSYDDAVFAGILIAIMLFAPAGLLRGTQLRALGALVRRAVGALAPRALRRDARGQGRPGTGGSP
ncbi:MAG: branched-chain amino acid ABC transporter permease [Spirochaetales bacterium]|nr:branched-chain amino acid ABC transporter permease [Spirochaetales bacterium]